MNKWWIPAVTALTVLSGCASVQQGSIPVVDSSSKVSNSERVTASRNNNGYRGNTAQAAGPQAQAIPADSGVTVMIPAGGSGIQTYSAPAAQAPFSVDSAPIDTSGAYQAPINSAPTNTASYSLPSTPTGIPSGNAGGLSADEQLDGPVLALLTTAQQQQSGGDLNGASSSLERAQRVAPREPQVLYKLAQVRLAQGDAAQAEQLSRRALTYANGRPSLQASLWDLIAQSLEKQGDAAGAAQARQKARVNL